MRPVNAASGRIYCPGRRPVFVVGKENPPAIPLSANAAYNREGLRSQYGDVGSAMADKTDFAGSCKGLLEPSNKQLFTQHQRQVVERAEKHLRCVAGRAGCAVDWKLRGRIPIDACQHGGCLQ